MQLALLFALGVINFAANKAVIESDHPILDQLPSLWRAWNGRVPLLAEFTVLLAAMLMAANGFPSFVWGYVLYSAFGLVSAWAILTHRL